MTTPELLDYIRNELQKGVDRNTITGALIGEGWMVADINEAFAALGPATPPPAAPAPMAQMPTAASEPTAPYVRRYPEPKRHSKLPAILVTILVILLLGAGGTYAYFNYVAPTFFQSPQDILKKSIPLTILHMRSFTYDFTATGTAMVSPAVSTAALHTAVPSTFTFNFSTDGSFDYHTEPAAMQMSLNAGAQSDDADESGSLSIGIDTIVVGQTGYLNLRNLSLSYVPKTGTDQEKAQMQQVMAVVNGMVTQLENTWVSATTSPQTMAASSTLSQADAEAIRDYFSGMSYLHSIKSLGDETVDGKAMHHYSFVFQDTGGLTDLLRKVGADQLAGKTSEIATLDQEMDSLSTILIQPIAFDIWIGRDDLMVYRIQSSPISYSDPEGRGDTTFSFSLGLSNFDQPVSITAPQNAVSIQTLIQRMFTNMGLGSIPNQAKY